jgi:hypothetical protein
MADKRTSEDNAPTALVCRKVQDFSTIFYESKKLDARLKLLN